MSTLHHPNTELPEQGRFARWMMLLSCVTLIAAIWLYALPKLADHPTVDARIHWLNEKQIDPAAMFYTELDCLSPYLDRIEE